LCDPRLHRQVGVKRDLLKPSHSERCASVAVLQVAKRPLNSRTTSVKVAESLSVLREAPEKAPAKRKRKRKGHLLAASTPERDEQRQRCGQVLVK
jgi:hypothetical protein